MRRPFILLFAILMCVGCATLEFKTQAPNGGQPITVKATAAMRSCLACEADPATGKIDCRVAQDASSDWVSARILPSIAQAVIAFFARLGGNATPVFEGPSEIGGCDSLFMQVEEDEEE